MGIRTIAIIGVLAGSFALGDGSDGGSGGSSTKQVSLHIPDEAAPPGGVVQMKFMVTEPTPISSGGPRFAFDTTFDAVWGIELFCPAGDVNGVALINGSQVNVFYTTSAGASGNDYPIMTVALHVRPDAAAGTKTQFQLDPSSTWILGLLGAATLKPQPPATVTVGGSISITNVVPGGGILPAGTVVKIQGMGFGLHTQVQLNAIKASSIQIVSANEIQFTLAQVTNMTGQKIQVVNPDGSQDTYFSYLRGVSMLQSDRPLLQQAVPIFSAVTHSQALYAPMGLLIGQQFSGVAVQNPGLSAAQVTVTLYSPFSGPLGRSTLDLPAGSRLIAETSELTGGIAPLFGSYVVISSTQPVQSFAFIADPILKTFLPFAALVAQP